MHNCKQKFAWATFPALLLCLLTQQPVPDERAESNAADLPGISLLSAAPRHTALLLYIPNLERLAAAWALAEPLQRTTDPLARWIVSPLEAMDKRFLRAWSGRTGIAFQDLARAIPGEAVIGWLPSAGGKPAAPQMDHWVLLARRNNAREDALRELWRGIAARQSNAGRIERRAVGPAAVEEILWTESTPAPPATPRRPRSPGGRPATPPPDTSLFQEIQRIERRAFSLGLSEHYVFFAPAPAEALSPWINAAVEGVGAAGLNGQLEALLQDVKPSGELLLVVKAAPPAWVAASESEKERRFGANPARVLLSQTRSLHAVLTQQDGGLQVVAEATVLPAPGWVAQLLAPLKTGAIVSTDDACPSQMVFRADLPEMWKAMRSVLMEGWPTVAAALDLFFAPLAGGRGDGVGRLAWTLGDEATLYAFRASNHGAAAGTWALAVAVREPSVFVEIEPRLADFLATLGQLPVRYGVAPDGVLVPCAEPPATTTSLHLPRVHTVLWNERYLVAGSQDALEKAIRAASVRPKATPDNTASLALRHEVYEGSEIFGLVEPTIRRTVQAPDGTVLDLISPPKAADASSTAAAPEAEYPARAGRDRAALPLGCLTASLTVQSANIVRLQIRLEGPGGSARVESKTVPSDFRKQPRLEE